MNAGQPELLTAAEAAQSLRLSARKVYELAASGELACIRYGSGPRAAVRFDPADLQEFKSRCRQTPKPAVSPPAVPAPAPAPTSPYCFELTPGLRAYFGMDRPKVEWPEVAPPTPAQLRRQRKAEETRRQEDRRALVTFHANKRRAARLQRTPPWADEDAIRAMYQEAQRLTRETGIPHHVDHVIPLQGRLVSGLHVHTNLQILTGSENSKKRNRFEVEP